MPRFQNHPYGPYVKKNSLLLSCDAIYEKEDPRMRKDIFLSLLVLLFTISLPVIAEG